MYGYTLEILMSVENRKVVESYVLYFSKITIGI